MFLRTDKLVKHLHSTSVQSDIMSQLQNSITSDHAAESWADTENKVHELLTTKLKLKSNQSSK